MVTKHFAYADCNSDSRYSHKEHMKDVYFMKSPHGKKNSDRCKKLVDACCREDLNFKCVTRFTYICSKHFVGGNGPTADHPDPIHDIQHVISQMVFVIGMLVNHQQPLVR